MQRVDVSSVGHRMSPGAHQVSPTDQPAKSALNAGDKTATSPEPGQIVIEQQPEHVTPRVAISLPVAGSVNNQTLNQRVSDQQADSMAPGTPGAAGGREGTNSVEDPKHVDVDEENAIRQAKEDQSQPDGHSLVDEFKQIEMKEDDAIKKIDDEQNAERELDEELQRKEATALATEETEETETDTQQAAGEEEEEDEGDDEDPTVDELDEEAENDPNREDSDNDYEDEEEVNTEKDAGDDDDDEEFVDDEEEDTFAIDNDQNRGAV